MVGLWPLASESWICGSMGPVPGKGIQPSGSTRAAATLGLASDLKERQIDAVSPNITPNGRRKRPPSRVAVRVESLTPYLPDPDAILWLDILRVPLFHAERFVPGVDVAEGGEGAHLAGGMRVGGDELAEGIVARQRAPHLGPAQEDALIAGEAVDHRGRLAVQREMVGVQGHQDAAEVADVLAHRQLADDVAAGELREVDRLVLRAVLRGLHLELRGIFRSPPVAQHAGAVR